VTTERNVDIGGAGRRRRTWVTHSHKYSRSLSIPGSARSTKLWIWRLL
jgi:hypothetical protein